MEHVELIDYIVLGFTLSHSNTLLIIKSYLHPRLKVVMLQIAYISHVYLYICLNLEIEHNTVTVLETRFSDVIGLQEHGEGRVILSISSAHRLRRVDLTDFY